MERSRRWKIIVAVFLFIGILVYPSTFDAWSPYQKITVKKIDIGHNISINQVFANNIAHQQMYDIQILNRLIYNIPYTLFNNSHYKNALIIGAGTGNDVETALAHGVRSIDAVEIDPVIYKVGVRLHPNKPYNDPRVHVYIDDARSFLEKNKT